MILVVSKCAECPMVRTEDETKVCAVSTPKGRPIPDLNDRPSFCPLRREQIIVRQFQ
jgi:hypothetical protein